MMKEVLFGAIRILGSGIGAGFGDGLMRWVLEEGVRRAARVEIEATRAVRRFARWLTDVDFV